MTSLLVPSLIGPCTHSTYTAKAEQDLEGLASEAVFKMKKEQKRKREEEQEEKREEQKRAIAEELERLDQAVAALIETIVAPFSRPGRKEKGKRGGILEVLKNVRAAVRRILTRVFGKGGKR